MATINLTPQLLVALVALGMALSFLSADRQSNTSRALAVALAATGIAMFVNRALIPDSAHAPSWSGWLALPEAIAIVAMLEWLMRVRRTVPVPATYDVRAGDGLLRLGQLSGVAYWLLAMGWPDVRVQQFLRAANGLEALGRPGFWLFAAPVLLSTLTGLSALLLLLNRRPDRSERARLLGFAFCVPFLCAGFVLPANLAAISIVIGEMILLIGSVHYHVLQGERGLFISRFLSPEVAKLVSERGLRSAMQHTQLTITVVSCDLRGFSSFARIVPSERVIRVLREYYDEVGAVVAQSGATIKDYAGDGILILVGAPLPMDDHAPRALLVARSLRAACLKLIPEWRADGPPLGIGVGVATGPVTVGVIGGVSRLEYTAVGSAVNLACRLCEQALDGEILVDEATMSFAGSTNAEARPPLRFKGFPEPVEHFRIGL